MLKLNLKGQWIVVTVLLVFAIVLLNVYAFDYLGPTPSIISFLSLIAFWAMQDSGNLTLGPIWAKDDEDTWL